MTKSRVPSLLTLARWIVRANPREPPILYFARPLRMTESQIRKLRRYVDYILDTEYGSSDATDLEDAAAELIQQTSDILPTANVDSPSPSDWNRVAALYTFPDDQCGACDEQLTCGKCAAHKRGECEFEHDSGPFYELLSFVTSATVTLDISMYIFSCQFIADKILELARTKPSLMIRIVTDYEMAHDKISMIKYMRFQQLPNLKIKTIRPLMHDKVIVVDGTMVITGSANLSVNAVVSNHENTVVMVGTRVGAYYLIKFDKLWAKGAAFPLYKNFPARKVWRSGRVSRSKPKKPRAKPTDKPKPKAKSKAETPIPVTARKRVEHPLAEDPIPKRVRRHHIWVEPDFCESTMFFWPRKTS